jgi:hypothetical protein
MYIPVTLANWTGARLSDAVAEGAACEKEPDPRRQRRMMQSNSNNGITDASKQ